MKISRSKICGGFSLLEVVVAMSLLLLILLLLAQINSTALNFWQHSQEQIKRASEARTALQIITKDLRSAVLLSNISSPKKYFFSASGPDAKNGFLYFLAAFTPKKKNPSNLGNLCIVGYFLSSEKNSRGNRVHHLYRFYLSSESTAEALRDDTLLESSCNAASIDNPLCERIASDIANFQVTPIWYEEKYFSTDVIKNREIPILVEIVLETTSQGLSTKNQPWRTVVALHP